MTTKAALKNLKVRYSLLRYFMFNLLKERQTGALLSPLFMHYDQPALLDTLRNTTRNQFMLGDSLMAAPLLYEDTFSQKVYFPEDMCHFHSGETYSAESTSQIDNHLTDYTDLFLTSGSIVQVQNTQGVRSSKDLKGQVSLKACLDSDLSANGTMLLPASIYDESALIRNCID